MLEDVSPPTGEFEEEIRSVSAYKREAESARRDRIVVNARNWDYYHLKQDFSHKKTGQSMEFLPKQSMGVEQVVSYVHQGLVDLGEWFSVDPEPANTAPIVTKDQARLLMSRQLEKAGFFNFIRDALQAGLLEALMVAKVHGRMVERPVFFTEKEPNGAVKLKRRKNQAWELRLDLIRARDWYPDPTKEKNPLYQIHQVEMDLWELIELAKEANEEKPGSYDLNEIEALSGFVDDIEKRQRERETNQAPSEANYRKRVVLDECWGTIVSNTGEVLHRNAMCVSAHGRVMLRKPSPNPNWHGKTPFVVGSILRVAHSVWHKALMDAPTSLNQAHNELFNLILDSGINAVFGVRQVREDWLDNADEMSNGIAPGFVAKANASCPPGAKAIETVSTGQIDLNQALQVLNLTNAELQASMLTNDLRQGVTPSRAVKATEVVEASQSITSVFTGLAKSIENSFIEPLLDMAWLTMWQNADDWDSAEIEAILGKDKAKEIAKLSPEERFEKVVNGHRFKVFGITQTLNKIKDFKKLTSLLQTVGGSQTLMEEFSKDYDVKKLLTEIIKSLDVNIDKIKLDETDAVMSQMGQAQGAQSPGGEGSPVNGLPDQQSQTPQMSATAPEQSEQSISALPQTHFSGRAFNGG